MTMSKNLFNSVQLKAPSRNHFDLTHDVKLSCDMGELVPIMVMDCVPGDKIDIGCEALIRFAPLVSPVMHRFNASFHYFFVPNRILWDGWEEWITDPASERVFPYVVTSPEVGSLADYLGLPQSSDPGGYFASALPFAAYAKIWYEYYRDQNLQVIDEADITLTDGANSLTPLLGDLWLRAWSHDYFTSCLPFAQKGSAVDIPLGDVMLKDAPTSPGQFWLASSHSPDINQTITTDGGDTIGTLSNEELVYNPNGTLEVEATTITDLRRAFRLQEWLEMQARGGTRYTEQIRTQFNVVSSDARLQRPEYITGVRQPVIISEILNTTGTEDLPQGNMAGHGVAAISGRHGSYFCEEHGYIIGIMSILPDTAYQQGIPKHFLKVSDQFEYFWPSFANIGEQEVLNQELYIDHVAPNATFGYIPRYAEYKFINNRVAGQFKTTLNTWHAGRIFSSDPSLNAEFIECKPTKRIFAVTDEEQDSIFCHVLNKVHAIRPMPKYGNPYM